MFSLRSTVLLLALATSTSSMAATGDKGAAPGPSHWVDKTGGLPNEPITLVVVDPFDDRVIYAGLDGFLFRSDDSGDSFAPVLSFPRGLGDDGGLNNDVNDTDGTGADDDRKDVGAAAAADDAAADAADAANDNNDQGADDLPDGSFDARGGGGGAERDADDDEFAVPARSEAGVRAVAFVPGSAGVLVVGTSGGLYRSTNSGGSFTRLPVPGGVRENDVRDVAIDPDRPSRLFVATASGLFISKDGGASFDRGDGRVGRTAVVCLAVTSGTLLVGTERGLLRSRDAGETFNDLLLRGQPAFPLIHAVAIADEGRTAYAGVNTGLYAAERNSAILEHYQGMPDDAPTQILPDPTHIGGVVIATRSKEGGAFFSNDIGLTTVNMEALPATQVLGLSRERKDSARLWAATERGLFRLEPGTGVHISKDELAELRERFAKEPPLTELIDKAVTYQRDDVDMDSARSRAGWAAILPELSAGYQFDYGDSNQARTQFLFVVGVGQPPTSDPEAELTDRFNNGLVVLQPEQKLDHRVWVDLTWDLDRLILSPGAMVLGHNAYQAAHNRQVVADAVRSLYITRRRLLAQVTLDARHQKSSMTKKEQLKRIHTELEILEVEARLAGLVGEDAFDNEPRSASDSASDSEER